MSFLNSVVTLLTSLMKSALFPIQILRSNKPAGSPNWACPTQAAATPVAAATVVANKLIVAVLKTAALPNAEPVAVADQVVVAPASAVAVVTPC